MRAHTCTWQKNRFVGREKIGIDLMGKGEWSQAVAQAKSIEDTWDSILRAPRQPPAKGARVVFVELLGRTRLNLMAGNVTSEMANAESRWRVELLGIAEPINVRAHQLLVLEHVAPAGCLSAAPLVVGDQAPPAAEAEEAGMAAGGPHAQEPVEQGGHVALA